MRSHSIAGWGSRKSRRILLFPSKTHSGWNYGCRRGGFGRGSTDFTTVGLRTAAGDGFAVSVAGGAAIGVAAWAIGVTVQALPRMTISTRRFVARPSVVRLVATG